MFHKGWDRVCFCFVYYNRKKLNQISWEWHISVCKNWIYYHFVVMNWCQGNQRRKMNNKTIKLNLKKKCRFLSQRNYYFLNKKKTKELSQVFLISVISAISLERSESSVSGKNTNAFVLHCCFLILLFIFFTFFCIKELYVFLI